jgi:hypothetical protein
MDHPNYMVLLLRKPTAKHSGEANRARVSILPPSAQEVQPRGERRQPMELLLVIVILLLLFGGFRFSRR